MDARRDVDFAFPTVALYRRAVKYLLALILVPGVALPEIVFHGSTGAGHSVCPLSKEQTEKSIEAFGKIFPVLTQEPRCVNCHGGVNPFIEGVGDPSDPAASRFEHGGGQMDEQTDCAGCHDAMAPKSDGTPSDWRIPGPDLFFIGKDAETLCTQMHVELESAETFLGHLRDDNGKDNFVGTAFMGNRGLSRAQYPEIPPQRPRIGADELVKLGQDWIAATGGRFRFGYDAECGCRPFRYAIRLSTLTEVKSGALQMKSRMEPVDIPITFKDDGSFSGEGMVNFTGEGTASPCSAQYGSTVNIRATGEVVWTDEEHHMRLQLENTAPAVNSVSAQCPQGSLNRPNVPGADSPSTVLPFKFDGQIGEYQIYRMPGPAGLSSELRVEIVELR